MPPDHPLANDVDVPATQVAEAQAACAFTLGRLYGLLERLEGTEKRLFCWSLVKRTLLNSLRQAGYDEVEARFDPWFAGIGRAPDETRLTSAPAHTVVRAILLELSHHGWPPVAEAARVISIAGRFPPDRTTTDGDMDPEVILRRAREAAQASRIGPSPFPGLERLMDRLRADPDFMPMESDTIRLAFHAQPLEIGRPAPRTPLWSVDLCVGEVMDRLQGPPLPFPGAITQAPFSPALWPGERAILVAEALDNSAARHIQSTRDARRACEALKRQLDGRRASSRAPDVWAFLEGFAPLTIDQLSVAFGVSRRGTYSIMEALETSRLARRDTVLGRVVLRPLPQEHRSMRAQEPPSPYVALDPALNEVDEALAAVDRLLARRN